MSKIRRDRMYKEHQQKSATSGTKKASEELVKRDDAQKILELSMSDDDSESQEEDESSDQDQKNLVQHGKPAQLKEKETSRKRINVLKAITRDLLAQEDRPSTLEEHHITSAAGRNNDLSSKEVAALQSIYNMPRPFVPTSKYATYPALMLPIIMIANIVQRAAGYAMFARDFCPDVRPSHLHSLTVDASSLYELFGSAAGEFDILSENKSVITSEPSARHSKSTVFGSFLDLNKVNSVCAEYGLQFQDRMTITPSGLTRLLASNDSNTMTTTQQSDAEDHVSNLNTDIKAAEAELRRKRQSLKLASQKVKSFKTQKKALEKAERPTVTGVLKAAKMERNQHQSAILEQQNDLRHFRKQRHILLKKRNTKSSKAFSKKSTKEPEYSTPTLRNHRCEDSSEYIVMNVLTTECQKANKELVFAGTDYGIKTLSTTVPITLSTYESHLEMFNSSTRSANQESCPQLPRPLRITADQIDQLCLSKAHTRKRRKRKENSPQVQLAEDLLSKNSIQLAKTVGDAIECHLEGVQTRQVLRDFYHSPRSMKEKRVQEF
ncbi:hypothetical protein Unana1_03269 [Umbelopsis nana]